MPCLGNCLASSSATVDLRKESVGQLSDTIESKVSAKAKSYKKLRNSFFGDYSNQQPSTSSNNQDAVAINKLSLDEVSTSLKPGKPHKTINNLVKNNKKSKKSSKMDLETHPKMIYLSQESENKRNETEESIDMEIMKPLVAEVRREEREEEDDDVTRPMLFGRKPPNEIEESPLSPVIPTMDFNLYAAKKNISQGLIDIALLTANFSQLKFILSKGLRFEIDLTEKWTKLLNLINLTLICLSIGLQVLVGIALLLSTRLNLNDDGRKKRAETCNTLIIVCVFIITVINIFIVVFLDGYEEFELI